ncbi:MAG: NADH-quinone oxidoreductase subunit C, partial [Candidatus Thermoplasmatota archaeon]|nr:NADH-quinone oxidoreductase subunit C [Candidatus Thermoplasmatota archaeon]
MMKPMNGEDVLALFQKRMGSDIISSHVDVYLNGVKKKKLETVWIRVPREKLLDAVKIVDEMQSPAHIAVASGSDLGDDIEVLYHFQVFWGYNKNTTISVTIGTTCPKSDPHLPTIS